MCGFPACWVILQGDWIFIGIWPHHLGGPWIWLVFQGGFPPCEGYPQEYWVLLGTWAMGGLSLDGVRSQEDWLLPTTRPLGGFPLDGVRS